jgi:hypothetical protein
VLLPPPASPRRRAWLGVPPAWHLVGRHGPAWRGFFAPLVCLGGCPSYRRSLVREAGACLGQGDREGRGQASNGGRAIGPQLPLLTTAHGSTRWTGNNRQAAFRQSACPRQSSSSTHEATCRRSVSYGRGANRPLRGRERNAGVRRGQNARVRQDASCNRPSIWISTLHRGGAPRLGVKAFRKSDVAIRGCPLPSDAVYRDCDCRVEWITAGRRPVIGMSKEPASTGVSTPPPACPDPLEDYHLGRSPKCTR